MLQLPEVSASHSNTDWSLATCTKHSIDLTGTRTSAGKQEITATHTHTPVCINNTQTSEQPYAYGRPTTSHLKTTLSPAQTQRLVYSPHLLLSNLRQCLSQLVFT